MTTKLKSKTGCLTCLTRRKKCDEALPKCGSCRRLHLACVPRGGVAGSGGSGNLVVNTSLRVALLRGVGASPTPSPALNSADHEPFRNDFERRVTLHCHDLFNGLCSALAEPTYHNLDILRRMCCRSRLVRGAVVAYSADNPWVSYGMLPDHLAVQHYQTCVGMLLVQIPHFDALSWDEQDAVVVTVFFLGSYEVRGKSFRVMLNKGRMTEREMRFKKNIE